MTHRGPFQPLLFCDSVILLGLPLRGLCPEHPLGECKECIAWISLFIFFFQSHGTSPAFGGRPVEIGELEKAVVTCTGSAVVPAGQL